MPDHTDLTRRTEEWIAGDPDETTRTELTALLAASDWETLAERMDGVLEFGTAGIRGAVEAGSNRMNRAVVIRTTAGLSDFLLANRSGSIVVGFDGRTSSRQFAEDTVAVLTAAGHQVLWQLWILLALLLGVPTLRLRADYLAIVTIAAAEIIRQVVGSVSLLEYFGGQDGLQQFSGTFASLNPYDSAKGMPGVVTWRAYDFWVMTVGWILVALSCLIVFLLMRSPWGRVLRGIREDEDAVRSLGKNVYAYKMQSLVIGGIFGALAGFVIALRSAAINPSFFATDVTFFAYTVLLIGGAARVFGPVAGAVIFWFLITFLDVFFDQATRENLIPDYIMTGTQASLIRFMFMGLALMLLMIYRPQGIFGDRRELALDAR